VPLAVIEVELVLELVCPATAGSGVSGLPRRLRRQQSLQLRRLFTG